MVTQLKLTRILAGVLSPFEDGVGPRVLVEGGRAVGQGHGPSNPEGVKIGLRPAEEGRGRGGAVRHLFVQIVCLQESNYAGL